MNKIQIRKEHQIELMLHKELCRLFKPGDEASYNIKVIRRDQFP
jgi:hypothetical protein